MCCPASAVKQAVYVCVYCIHVHSVGRQDCVPRSLDGDRFGLETGVTIYTSSTG